MSLNEGYEDENAEHQPSHDDRDHKGHVPLDSRLHPDAPPSPLSVGRRGMEIVAKSFPVELTSSSTVFEGISKEIGMPIRTVRRSAARIKAWEEGGLEDLPAEATAKARVREAKAEARKEEDRKLLRKFLH